MSSPRIAPGGRREVGVATWVISRIAGRVAGTAPINLFLTLGRHRKLFRRWLVFAGGLMPGGSLARRESELVILRVAHLRGSDYELAHHRRLGRKAGLSGEEIERTALGSAVDGWSPRERALLAAVEGLHEQGDLDDATWAELRRHFGDREAIEVCLLTGHYEMLATTIAALRIQPDASVRG